MTRGVDHPGVEQPLRQTSRLPNREGPGARRRVHLDDGGPVLAGGGEDEVGGLDETSGQWLRFVAGGSRTIEHAGDPTTAWVPAETTSTVGRPASRRSAAAAGERQMLAVQT